MRYKFAYIKIIHVLKFQVRDKSAFRHSLEYEFHIITKKMDTKYTVLYESASKWIDGYDMKIIGNN